MVNHKLIRGEGLLLDFAGQVKGNANGDVFKLIMDKTSDQAPFAALFKRFSEYMHPKT
jgi:hypothetical protein